MGDGKSNQKLCYGHPQSVELAELLKWIFGKIAQAIFLLFYKKSIPAEHSLCSGGASPKSIFQSISITSVRRFKNRLRIKREIRRRRIRIYFFVLLFSLTVFIHSKNSFFQPHQYLLHYFEKPCRLLFHQYRIAPLHLHLKEWAICNQHQSLELVLYAAMPRNPE